MTLAWIFVGIVGVLFIASQVATTVLHNRWMREGQQLSEEFDVLWRERRDRFDDRVARAAEMSAEEREVLRSELGDWFTRMETQQAKRRRWSERGNAL